MNRSDRSKAPRLFTPPPADESTLSERQAFALKTLREHPEGLTGDQLGRVVHPAFTTNHHHGCQWCGSHGLSLARALKTAGLVTQHRAGVYRAVGACGGAADRPEDDPFEWPPGFGDAA